MKKLERWLSKLWLHRTQIAEMGFEIRNGNSRAYKLTTVLKCWVMLWKRKYNFSPYHSFHYLLVIYAKRKVAEDGGEVGRGV